MDKYLLDTDVLVDYLTSTDNKNQDLINFMQTGICFTTVLNASELLATELEKGGFNVKLGLEELKTAIFAEHRHPGM